MDLSRYSTRGFSRGAPRWKEALWLGTKLIFFQMSVPWPSALRVGLLRVFGARVGRGVVIRERVNISFPWRLELGDHVWLGEEVMILSLACVTIESNVCISQRAFLCTGSHNFQSPDFDLLTSPIVIRSRSWIAAQAFIGPGVEVGPGSMVAASSVVSRNVPPNVLVRGNPAALAKRFD